MVARRFEPSGVASYAATLCGALVKGGHDVLFAHGGGAAAALLERTGARSKELPGLGSVAKDLFVRRALRRTALAFSPDIVHAVSPEALGLARASAAGAPVVLTLHRFEQATVDARRVSSVIVPNETLREHAVNKLALPAEIVAVAGEGVDLSVYPRKSPVRAGKVSIGAVGKLEHEKGFEDLIRAASLLKASRVEHELVIVGEGPDRRRLEKLASDLGVRETTTFLGARLELPAVLSTFHVFAAPSRTEGAGLCVLEAFAAWCPVVATAVGGMFSAVRDGVDGILVRPCEPEALAAALKKLIASPELREELALAGREKVESEHSAEKMAARTVELYARAREGQKT